jgi:hypothetical protein
MERKIVLAPLTQAPGMVKFTGLESMVGVSILWGLLDESSR